MKKSKINIVQEQLTIEMVHEYLLEIFQHRMDTHYYITIDNDYFICEYLSKDFRLTTGIQGFLQHYLGGPITVNNKLLSEEEANQFIKQLENEKTILN